MNRLTIRLEDPMQQHGGFYKKTQKISHKPRPKEKEIKRVPLVYYHHMCSDGIAGAWCAWRHFTAKGITVEYKGIQTDKIININEYDHGNRDVYFIDVLGTKDLVSLCKVANRVIVIDHHKPNKEYVDGLTRPPANLSIIFDISKAACQIAWDHFNPGIDRPWFINYIAERDLWDWNLTDSKAINAGLFNLGHLQNIEAVNNLYLLTGQDLVNTLETVKSYGNAIIKYHAGLLEKIANSATEVTFTPPGNIGKYKCWIASIHREISSELGNILAEKPLKSGDIPTFSAVYTFDFRTGNWIVSLRGIDGGVDVNMLAKQFGGGGHTKAASFVIKAPDLLKNYFVM